MNNLLASLPTITQIKEEKIRRFYPSFLDEVHRNTFKYMKHTRLIIKYLQRIADGENLNLLIEMPPRHGKSITVTESFPSYYLCKNPDKKVIASAYSDGLAKKFGRLNKNKFDEVSEVFGLNLSKNLTSQKNWGIENHRGGMISTGIGGSITGEGANLMIIDDPIKNMKEAKSKVIRQNIWDEWEATLSTRLEDDSSLIVIQTRWHEDDLIGRLVEQSPREFIRIRLPAIAEDNDMIGRERGEPLAPELGYDEEWAEEKEREVGSKVWASLYQQRPSPEAGGIIKEEWLKYYNTAPARFDKITISWDMSFKDGEKSSYVVGTVWGKKKADDYLLDMYRRKAGFNDTLRAVKNLSSKYDYHEIIIEDKANGPAIIDALKREIPRIIPVSPSGSKIERLEAHSPRFEAGNIYLPENKQFTYDFVDEIVTFPNAVNDDIVDSTSQYLERTSRKREASILGYNNY